MSSLPRLRCRAVPLVSWNRVYKHSKKLLLHQQLIFSFINSTKAKQPTNNKMKISCIIFALFVSMASAVISLDMAKTCKKYIQAVRIMHIKSQTGAHKQMTAENMRLISHVSAGRRAGCPALFERISNKPATVYAPCKQFFQKGRSTICL